jgi:hypothetical protein
MALSTTGTGEKTWQLDSPDAGDERNRSAHEQDQRDGRTCKE